MLDESPPSRSARVRARTRFALPLVAALALVALVGVQPADAAPAIPDRKAVPFLHLDPEPTVVVPDAWNATGVLQGQESMRGTLTLTLHPAGDLTCAQAPLTTRTWPVVGPTFWLPTYSVGTTTTPGTWYWRASYSGDADHAAVSECRPQLVLGPTTPRHHPFPDWASLVRRQYGDVLARGPIPAELDEWVDLLAGRTTVTAGDLVASLRADADNRTNVDPVVRLYRAYFLRDPDQLGLTHWVAQRRGGRSLNSISAFFATSSEFRTRYGALSEPDFVDLVYRNVLGRNPDAGGRAFWIAELESGRRPRGNVMTGFSESSEYRSKQADTVEVTVLYAFLLGRSPTPEERRYALLALGADRLDAAGLADALLDRPEYATRVTGFPPVVPSDPVVKP